MKDTATKGRKELIEELEWLESEADIAEYCKANGLDYTEASDYAKAVIATQGKHKGKEPESKSSHSNARDTRLHQSNSIDPPTPECYTGISDEEILKRLEKLEDRFGTFGEYSLGSRIWGSLRKAAKVVVSRCIVRNNTSHAIAVAGSPIEDHNRTIQAWIPRGHTTQQIMFDVDAVVIASGQRFRVPGGGNKTKTEGAIKVRDSWAGATVYETKDDDGKTIFYVKASLPEYIPPSMAEGLGWVTPG